MELIWGGPLGPLVQGRSAVLHLDYTSTIEKKIKYIRATGYGLRATGYELRATGYELRAKVVLCDGKSTIFFTILCKKIMYILSKK